MLVALTTADADVTQDCKRLKTSSRVFLSLRRNSTSGLNRDSLLPTSQDRTMRYTTGCDHKYL